MECTSRRCHTSSGRPRSPRRRRRSRARNAGPVSWPRGRTVCNPCRRRSTPRSRRPHIRQRVCASACTSAHTARRPSSGSPCSARSMFRARSSSCTSTRPIHSMCRMPYRTPRRPSRTSRRTLLLSRYPQHQRRSPRIAELGPTASSSVCSQARARRGGGFGSSPLARIRGDNAERSAPRAPRRRTGRPGGGVT